jgi:hypothetical protein
MSPQQRTPLKTAARTPLRLLAGLTVLLLAAAPVSAQLPVSADLGVQTPVGSIQASAQDTSLNACAYAAAGVPGVTAAGADACASASPSGASLGAGASTELAQLRTNASADPTGAHAGAHGHAAGIPIDEEVRVPPAGLMESIEDLFYSIGGFFKSLWP